MLLFYMLALVFITVLGIKAAPRGEYFSDYTSREHTTCIKGFFAVIIVFSHMLQYVKPENAADMVFYRILWLIGQFMVTMFFFYSGYGILESVKKRPDYFNSFFANRFLKTLVHFDLAIALFYLLNFFIGDSYSTKKTLLAFTGWTSIGNSNWFIFSTLALYLLTLAAFAVFRKKRTAAVVCVAILTAGFMYLLSHFKASHWYNTLLCYPLGMIFSLIKDKLDALFAKRHALYRISLVLSALITAVLPLAYSRLGMSKELYNLVLYPTMSCAFSSFIVLASMKIAISNKALYWLGINSFSIYILQRLPMNLLRYLGLDKSNLIFPIIAIAATMLIAPAFTALTDAIDKLLFRKKPSAPSVSAPSK